MHGRDPDNGYRKRENLALVMVAPFIASHLLAEFHFCKSILSRMFALLGVLPSVKINFEHRRLYKKGIAVCFHKYEGSVASLLHHCLKRLVEGDPAVCMRIFLGLH